MSKPTEDRAYLSWIRTLPCAACGSRFKIEAHHAGVRGLSQRADDRSAIPLCFRHHDRRQPYSIHKLGSVKFQELFCLDIPALVQKLSAKPRIGIDAGYYINRETNETLVPVQHGLRKAVRKILDLRKEQLQEAS